MIIINQRYTFVLFGEADMAYKTQMLCTYLQEVMNKTERGMVVSAEFMITLET